MSFGVIGEALVDHLEELWSNWIGFKLKEKFSVLEKSLNYFIFGKALECLERL
jgi:hypothetical protein